MVTIHETTNYSQFKFLERNRPVTGNRVFSSIQKKNLLSSHPIIVDRDFNVMDGQHRLEAARLLNLPIFYIIDENAEILDVPINQVQKSWSMDNFLEFFKEENEDYKTVHEIKLKYNFPLNFIIKSISSDLNSHQRFRLGTFKVSKKYKKDKLMTLFVYFDELRNICSTICMGHSVYFHSRAAVALWRIVNEDDFDILTAVQRFSKNRDGVIESLNLFSEKLVFESLLKKVYLKSRTGRKCVKFL